MELLLSKNPMLATLRCKAVNEYVTNYINEADKLNIATGFISNQSLATIRRAVEQRAYKLNVDLFVGMNYLNGFTQLQYNSLTLLNNFLQEKNCGKIYLSPKALYHGKMYSFIKNDVCIGAFIGSSNLDSFVSSSTNYVECDALFIGEEAKKLNEKVNSIIKLLGVDFVKTEKPKSFLKPEEELFTDYDGVVKVPEAILNKAKSSVTGEKIYIELKTCPKSNLNTFFGAGKQKNKYSPRNWYEVEIILSKRNSLHQLIPYDPDSEINNSCHIQVITEDGYLFEMCRQGTHGKNFRSTRDLKILGRWIKGHMEMVGALEVGQPITEEILDRYGKHNIVLQKTFDNYWLLKLE